MEGLEENLVETIRARMLEMDSAGSLDIRVLQLALRRVTGHGYSQSTLRNFRSGHNTSFRLALGIAATGLIAGAPAVAVPDYLRRQMNWAGRAKAQTRIAHRRGRTSPT